MPESVTPLQHSCDLSPSYTVSLLLSDVSKGQILWLDYCDALKDVGYNLPLNFEPQEINLWQTGKSWMEFGERSRMF